jgi:hypothetical protein
MYRKLVVVGIICITVLLVLSSGVSALVQTRYSLSDAKSSISVSSGEDYKVWIRAGMFRYDSYVLGWFHEGKFGLGWDMMVYNTGDTNISGFFQVKITKLNGEPIGNNTRPFSIEPDGGSGIGGATIFDLHPIICINLTVEIGNTTYSKSGYEIGPFVLLVD